MNLFSAACFIVCLLFLVESFRRESDLFSPGRMFVMIWTLAFGLMELKLSRLQNVWPTEVWLQVVLGPLAFLTGVFIIYVQNLDRPLRRLNDVRLVWQAHDVHAGRLFRVVVLLFGLYALAFCIILFLKGITPPLFSDRPGESRVEFTMFGIGLFLHNVAPIMFLTVVYAVSVEGQRSRKWMLGLLSFLAVLTYLTLLQRYQLMFGAVMAVGVAYYTTRHLRWATVIPYIAGAVGVFYWVSTLRSAIKLFLVYLYLASRMKFPVEYAWATEPYMYVSMNLENLARGIERLQQHTYGYYTFNFLASLSGLKHWIETYFALDETPFLVSSYNTYTAFWVMYRDFGIAGIMVLPLLAGLLIAWLYYAMRRAPSLESIALYSLCIFVILISFFNDPLAFLWFVYSIAIGAAALRYTRAEHPRSLGTPSPRKSTNEH